MTKQDEQKKHVEKAWAIKMDKFDGSHFFSCSREVDEHRCTFNTKQRAIERIKEWEDWQLDGNPRAVPVEIREL